MSMLVQHHLPVCKSIKVSQDRCQGKTADVLAAGPPPGLDLLLEKDPAPIIPHILCPPHLRIPHAVHQSMHNAFAGLPLMAPGNSSNYLTSCEQHLFSAGQGPSNRLLGALSEQLASEQDTINGEARTVYHHRLLGSAQQQQQPTSEADISNSMLGAMHDQFPTDLQGNYFSAAAQQHLLAAQQDASSEQLIAASQQLSASIPGTSTSELPVQHQFYSDDQGPYFGSAAQQHLLAAQQGQGPSRGGAAHHQMAAPQQGGRPGLPNASHPQLPARESRGNSSTLVHGQPQVVHGHPRFPLTEHSLAAQQHKLETQQGEESGHFGAPQQQMLATHQSGHRFRLGPAGAEQQQWIELRPGNSSSQPMPGREESGSDDEGKQLDVAARQPLLAAQQGNLFSQFLAYEHLPPSKQGDSSPQHAGSSHMPLATAEQGGLGNHLRSGSTQAVSHEQAASGSSDVLSVQQQITSVTHYFDSIQQQAINAQVQTREEAESNSRVSDVCCHIL